MTLNNKQKNELINFNIELKQQIKNVIRDLDNICNLLDKCFIQSYYVVSIYSRISESKIRAEMANIRTDEFLEEIKQDKISMNGFY